MFAELGLDVAPQLSSEAMVDGARLAARFVTNSGSAARARQHLYRTYVASDYPDLLAD